MNVKIAVGRQKFYKVLVGRHIKSLRTTGLFNSVNILSPRVVNVSITGSLRPRWASRPAPGGSSTLESGESSTPASGRKIKGRGGHRNGTSKGLRGRS